MHEKILTNTADEQSPSSASNEVAAANSPDSPPSELSRTNISVPDSLDLAASSLKKTITETSPKTPLLFERPTAATERFLAAQGRDLSVFAKDSSLHFSPSATAKTFAFFPETHTVELPLSWFQNEAYTADELKFASYHELSHFIDMRKNPEAFLDNFRQMRQHAKRLAASLHAAHPEAASQNSMENFYYQELHQLYNYLDDIYVNNVVFSRAFNFGTGENRASVTSLYQKLGFEDSDLTELPLKDQFTFALLRDEMVGNTLGYSQISPIVKQALLKEIAPRLTIRDIVNEHLKPKSGSLVDPAYRYKIIRKTIEPIYLDLLSQDLKQYFVKQALQTQQGEQQDQGDQGDQDNQGNQTQQGEQQDQSPDNSFNPFRQNNSTPRQKDSFHNDAPSEEDIRRILESFIEDDRIKNMSPEERNEHQKKTLQKEFDQKHNISATERLAYESTKTSIASARREMQKFWDQLTGKAIEYRRNIVKGQRRGRLNINSVINQTPQIVEAERTGKLTELNLYERSRLERVIANRPDAIDISLLVDCSGSMSEDRIAAARSAATLLMLSIKDFNAQLERTRHQTHSQLHANVEVIAFGSDYSTIKPFEKTATYHTNEASIIKSISAIDSDRGSTNDANPLHNISQNLSPKDRERIRSGKLKKIVMEITDGSPDSPTNTALAVKQLHSSDIITVAFQIGDVDEYERNIFESIWNYNQSSTHGVFIGNDINTLPRKLINAVSELLKDIKI